MTDIANEVGKDYTVEVVELETKESIVEEAKFSNGNETNGEKEAKSTQGFHKTRSSNRQIKKKILDLDREDPTPPAKLHHRQCERSSCTCIIPICFASASDRYYKDISWESEWVRL